MKTIFWIFTVLLLTMTMLSTLGGGIRYKENFIDDILDDTKLSVSDVDIEMIKSTLVTQENEVLVPPAPVTPSPPPKPSTKASPAPSKSAAFQPFDGDEFASF
jgi:hypothetical protein